MRTLFGRIVNENSENLSGVAVKLSDYANQEKGYRKSDGYGYKFVVSDDFKGRVIVEDQVIGQMKIYGNHAIVDATQGMNYNVVIRTKIFDEMDIDFNGIISFEELIAAVKKCQADIIDLKKKLK